MCSARKKNCLHEHWIQLIIGGFKTVSLAWIMKLAVIGYTCFLFIKEPIDTREECMPPPGFWSSVGVVSVWFVCQSPVVGPSECGERVGVGYGCVAEYCSGVCAVFAGLGCD